ncbi:uncharacterized protein LOC123037392 [Drosophila rhopaloa]|uniref:Uncharacterized protein n=1 Tax=Drosophila rhopaloa TaxID=1041015 RepID=A0ABM5J4B3_DRORH|nr:uncharacterized protein LOC123037392 [Drosophila rhopaloa]
MLLVLVVFQFICFTCCLMTWEVLKNNKLITPCEELFKEVKPNLVVIFQCLMTNYNLTETLADVMLKMEQVQHKMDVIISDDQKYKASPFKNIEDILDIPTDISNKDCQTKRQIVQAIRRKLEWDNVMNDQGTTLFAWPKSWKSDLSKPKFRHLIKNIATISKIQLRTEATPKLDEIRCLLAKAIRNTDWLRNLNDKT